MCRRCRWKKQGRRNEDVPMSFKRRRHHRKLEKLGGSGRGRSAIPGLSIMESEHLRDPAFLNCWCLSESDLNSDPFLWCDAPAHILFFTLCFIADFSPPASPTFLKHEETLSESRKRWRPLEQWTFASVVALTCKTYTWALRVTEGGCGGARFRSLALCMTQWCSQM